MRGFYTIAVCVSLIASCTQVDKPAPPLPANPVIIGQPADVGFQMGLLHRHNEQRGKIGAKDLSVHSDLVAAAQFHADWMAERGSLSHTGEANSSVGRRVTAASYDWSMVGENIAMGMPDEDRVMKAWMNSAPHRNNILNAGYTQCGFGVAKHKNGTLYWCAVFARPQQQGARVLSDYAPWESEAGPLDYEEDYDQARQ